MESSSSSIADHLPDAITILILEEPDVVKAIFRRLVVLALKIFACVVSSGFQ
jgi:hypothetical protein